MKQTSRCETVTSNITKFTCHHIDCYHFVRQVIFPSSLSSFILLFSLVRFWVSVDCIQIHFAADKKKSERKILNKIKSNRAEKRCAENFFHFCRRFYAVFSVFCSLFSEWIKKHYRLAFPRFQFSYRSQKLCAFDQYTAIRWSEMEEEGKIRFAVVQFQYNLFRWLDTHLYTRTKPNVKSNNEQPRKKNKIEEEENEKRDFDVLSHYVGARAQNTVPIKWPLVVRRPSYIDIVATNFRSTRSSSLSPLSFLVSTVQQNSSEYVNGCNKHFCSSMVR